MESDLEERVNEHFEAGTPAPQPVTAGPESEVKPHRGGVILALGIVGIVICFITGIIAWVMGMNDLKEMKEGQRDKEGESLTKAGMICGIIATALAVLGLLWTLFVFVLLGSTGVLGALTCLGT